MVLRIFRMEIESVWGDLMSLGFTYSSNTLMMHLQDLVGAEQPNLGMNDLDLENQLKVCLMEKHLVKLDE